MKMSIRGGLMSLMLASAAIPALAEGAADRPIAVQMYTLRNSGTLSDQLAIVKAAGITAVETVGTQNVTAGELKLLLDESGIKPISTHAALISLRRDLPGIIAFNKAIGNDTITVPNLPEAIRPTDQAGWEALGKELGEISAKVEAEGLSLAYHNHNYEIVDLGGGKTALEVIFENAGPDLEAELDLAWIARAGFDPAEFIGRFDGRVFAIHAKDNAPEGQAEDERGFAAVGAGVLDWTTILPAAEKADVKWYIIEHDLPKDAAAVVQTGANYLVENLSESVTR